MKGYLNDDKANEETFTSDGWMRTGDVAKYDSNSGEFFIIDRIKELIKYKGYQVAPAGKMKHAIIFIFKTTKIHFSIQTQN